MTEYESVNEIGGTATREGTLPPTFYDGVISLDCSDTSARVRDPASSICLFSPLGEYVAWIPGALVMSVPGVVPAASLQSEHLIGAHRYDGRINLFDGMFSARDKLARIGVVVTVSGVPLGNTDVILNGVNHREIVKTDHRGVWWKYLEIDEYPDALFISPNGIVYALLKQSERTDNEGIFDQIVRRRTLANATSRQLHRKFV
jgi:hypothetical protein